MWSAVAQKRKGNPERASFAQNVRVAPGIVATRPGTTLVTSAIGTVYGLFNWIAPSGNNYVLYMDTGPSPGIKSLLQPSTLTTLTSTLGSTYRPSFSDFDIWTYFTGYDTSGNGTLQCQIYDGTNVDTAFRGPITLTSCSPTDGGAGQCTAGIHYFGFVYQNRTGFAGVPTIKISGSAISFTVSPPGLRQINVAVTLPALSDGGGNAALFLIMTRADSSATWYFMPTDPRTGGVGEQPVPFNTITTLNFVANLSDEDMAAELAGDTANENFLLLTQDGSGNGPFNPSFVVAYGNRMCYGDGTTLRVSDVNDPQHLTGDQHIVRTPNQRNISYAFPLPGSTDLYLTGDKWTSRVTDNNDKPATWVQPIKVSDSLGAPLPACVCWRTRGNYAWVVTEAGVYVFDGNYAERPVTYLVSDQWALVNWAQAYKIETTDDVVGLRFYVRVPWDNTTAVFCIDYTNGIEYDQVDISIDIYPGNASSVDLTSIAVVKEPSKVTNLWLGVSGSFGGGYIVRLDPTAKSDYSGHVIYSIWETGLMRGKQDFNARMIRVGALDIWARGVGQLVISVFGPDKVQRVLPQLLSNSGIPAALTPAPGIMYEAKVDLARVENYTVRFENNPELWTDFPWFEISEVVGYAKDDLFNR
jgi:hypothetical protein